jgi:NAD(P)-dependent dehydrogenase (short-subunit alcohol dehydrogenase family)
MKILLTGAGKGIGRAILAALLDRFSGCRVWVLGRTCPDGAGIDPDRVRFRAVDLVDLGAAQRALAGAVADAGGFDVAINNAGFGKFAPVEELALEDWNAIMTLNATVPFLVIRACLPAMKANRRGRIISISSDADDLGFAGAAAYCASKHALKGMIRAVRRELKGTEVAVSLVSPGRVDTYFNGKSPGQRPLALQPADVAAAVIDILELPARCQISSIEMESVLE